jgi:polysaccharide export outer membrane protein
MAFVRRRSGFARHTRVVALIPGIMILMAGAGCQTPSNAYKEPADVASIHPETAALREGDVLRISFPGAPNLNTTQQIRTDGKITLPLVGEIAVAGMTPAEVEKELINRYSTQLVSKEVTVAVESASFPVYVTGAVLHPGKISSNHPLSALEAVMEAGGFDYTKANLKAVMVIRHEGGTTKHFTLNLKAVLQGEQSQSFYLKPSDIVYVPERFSWF